MIDIESLNTEQKEAVFCEDKYVRIVAGAGSGKTRVLTTRIAHLIQDLQIPPYKVLAITFTNKAANEMKERIHKMLGDTETVPWISTIHSLCVRILREDILSMGYPRNFTIMDADDQKSILKDAYKELNVDSTTYSYGSLLDYIANNKCADITVQRAYELAGSFTADKTKARIYEYYINAQQKMYALDFDDLILWTNRMFHKFPEILDKWQKRHAYLHVDEFQDIDKTQYELIQQLAGPHNSIYVVGDPDQTIYTWRGADVNIIMNFIKDYPSVKTIILKENYRSTDVILGAANSLIKNNRNRVAKDLFTERKGLEKIIHYAAVTDEYEANWIVDEIGRLHRNGKAYHDIAILYRSNFLSRNLEKALLDRRIPYIIYGGIRFYERQEVKDALCYLRMTTSADDLALRRIINRPKRGVGNKSLETLIDLARKENTTIYELLKRKNPLSGKAKKETEEFVNKVESWREYAQKENMEVFKLFEKIMEESGYQAMLEENQEYERIENLKELINDIKDFSDEHPEASIDEYLQTAALYGDREETMSSDFLQLMTVHASKGLEFDTVFVTDMNEGYFPNERAISEGLKNGVEEERRLAYVAFTRAENRLYVTEAGGFSYIIQRVRTTSRFIKEIDEEYIEHRGAIFQETQKRFSTAFKEESFDLEYDLDRSFEQGEQVVHEFFGEGIVLSLSDELVEIAFAYPHGVKKILMSHPALQKKKELN